ncbi:MAG: outer membrane protein assembly factor BamD [Gammaproteobacteria bacterium CG11_big_fil_rev_8_21_14_0_20_46_22]|nr:MAG: outer membrane protein assembly factor BamD [Gammaproteobacteria bacterium CG12_big_fil_rev_8_21_14_0_65_46_12]PIR11933.1 MAG: outer membrane protein assembly factor BamD [Gammaproteobacteria bacterium CG11_big_fil_rev_8_21_14_0_20_46_22]
MIKRRLHLFALLTAAALLLSACSKDVAVDDPGAPYKGKTEKQIYLGGRHALFHQDWDQCTKHFEGLLTLYPFGQYAKNAQLDIIYCYYKNDDVGMTLASADRFIQLYPMDKDVAYAYYMRGLSEFYRNRSFLDQHYDTDYAQRGLDDVQKSFLDFQHIISDYPHSKYAPDARRRMVYIRNIIALHNLEIAKFYFERHSYVAAANRANLVVQHFQQSTAVPGALVLMAMSYQRLGLKSAAAHTINVIKLNYPSEPDLQRLIAVQSTL